MTDKAPGQAGRDVAAPELSPSRSPGADRKTIDVPTVACEVAELTAGREALSAPTPGASYGAAFEGTQRPDDFWQRWRFEVLWRELRARGLDERAPLRGLDVGAAYGVFRGQLEAVTSWDVDASNVDRDMFVACRPGRGRTLLYDIMERHPELLGRYDLGFLLDVIEHVAEPRALLDATLAHLKPGGLLVVGVPALPALRSAFDDAQGHYRRYTARALLSDLAGLAVRPIALRAWGLGLVPGYAIRRLLMPRRSFVDEADRLATVARGLGPRGRLVNAAWAAWMRVELAWPWKLPLGSSLLCVARRDEAAGRS